MTKTRLILHCPEMLQPVAAPRPLPGVSFFDPAAADQQRDDVYAPQDLPLSRREARNWLSQTLAFGEQFADRPSEMAALGNFNDQDFGRESSHEIRGRLAGKDEASGENNSPDPRLAAQMTLLLAQNAEREILAAKGTGQGVAQAWERFRGSLGLAEGEDEPGAPSMPSRPHPADLDPDLAMAVPWKTALKAFWILAPDDAALFVDRADIIDAWHEAGIVFTHPPQEQWAELHPDWPHEMPGVLGLARVSGSELLGGDGGGRLGLERLVIAWTPGNEKE